MDNKLRPHEEEIDKIWKELEKAKDKGDYANVIKLIDRAYNLMFDTTLLYAKEISRLGELLQEGRLEGLAKKEGVSIKNIEEEKEIIRRYRDSLIEEYSEMVEPMKRMQEIQHENGLTNAPRG
jgi:hypothetical protein